MREEDYEREEILERAGWAIHRIPSRRYYPNPERELELVSRVLSEQATDEEQVSLEFEDLSLNVEGPAEPEFDAAPAVVSELPNNQRPPADFDDCAGWFEIARWARDLAGWTIANRTFLWEVGNNIHEGQALDETARTRAGVLWEIALRQGYRPARKQGEAVTKGDNNLA